MYRTRDKNEGFIESIKKAMQREITLDTIVYLACQENPLNESGQVKETNLYVLGGTHYL